VQASQASRLRRLQRQHGIDLSAVTITPSNSAASSANNLRGELVGFAAASALRSLKVPHIVEAASGVLVCDAEDLSAWSHRRHIELLTRLQQRRRRKRGEVRAFTSNSSDSDADTDHHVPHGMHASQRDTHMSDDLKSGSLTPGLSGRGAPHMQGGLNLHTSTLRASSLHAHHMMQPPPLPDSTSCIWDKQSALHAPSSNSQHNLNAEVSAAPTDPAPAPMHVDIGRLEHMHERGGGSCEEVNGVSVSGSDDNTHASHAHNVEESCD
jgi:hypothetical protein